MAQSAKTSQGEASLSSKVRLPSVKTGSAAYLVSTSSLTVNAEAVTHALRWIVILLTDSVSLLQSEKWSISTFEKSSGCSALDMPE